MADATKTMQEGLKTPKAAAIAGIVFAVLMVTIFVLIRSAVPGNPTEHGEWLTDNWRMAAVGLNLVPFAGIAFLWFIGVLRDRLGAKEDRFFATVFFGSSLLFLSVLFTAAAFIGGLVLIGSSADPNALVGSQVFHIVRATAYVLVNVYAAKVATVFMVSTSTVLIYTNIVSQWIAILGYILALILVLGSYFATWVIVVLPLWVLLISIAILSENFLTRTEI
jgi:hypothetical protein